MSVLGYRLKKAREDAGLTQIQAAKKLGISNGTLSGYERNYRDPDTSILEKMADLYDVSIDYLLGRTDEKDPKWNELTEKDEKDIAKRMEKLKNDLLEGKDTDGLSFRGEPMSEEAIESLLSAIEHAERIATLTNKKYIPKKYRKDNKE